MLAASPSSYAGIHDCLRKRQHLKSLRLHEGWLSNNAGMSLSIHLGPYLLTEDREAIFVAYFASLWRNDDVGVAIFLQKEEGGRPPSTAKRALTCHTIGPILIQVGGVAYVICQSRTSLSNRGSHLGSPDLKSRSKRQNELRLEPVENRCIQKIHLCRIGRLWTTSCSSPKRMLVTYNACLHMDYLDM